MKAFSEMSDLILRSLTSTPVSWDKFTELTKVTQYDAILVFLENKEFIEYTNQQIKLTAKGKEFISSSSFVEQRDNRSQA